jgi:PAS domain S-box-containing protein
MERVDRLPRELFGSHPLQVGRRTSSSLFCFALIILTVTLLSGKLHSVDLSSLLLGAASATFCVVVFFLSRSLLQLRNEQRQAVHVLDAKEASLLASEERFRQMADNIQEVFWMIDAQTGEALYANAAYEIITGRSLAALKKEPLSYEEIIHFDDRKRVLIKFEEAMHTGHFDEHFRIVWPNGEPRWLWVRGFPVRDIRGNIQRLVCTGLDITRQKEAEEEVARNLSMAESAWAESDALRKATLALTQDLRMDDVLDTLLESLRALVPFESANIFLLESDSHLFVAREFPHKERAASLPKGPPGFKICDYPIIRRVLADQTSVIVSDTSRDRDWRIFEDHSHLGSWICVPLSASQRILGLLSVGHSATGGLTPEHLRIAELLAIPAAAAIQNARLYERAEIYGEELEKRLADLRTAQSALASIAKAGDSPRKRFN